jgi:hypothetical protein
LVTEAVSHYQNLRETLSRMTGHRGYNNYFENYTPVLNEESDDTTSLNELFVEETLDPRIESVMPILKRLNKNINEMNEVKELEEWAESLTEVEDETTKTLAEPAEEMLDEAEKLKVQMDKRGGGVIYNAFKKDKPADVVKRVKSQDTDTLKMLSNRGSTGKGSPAELQQKVISRELKKRDAAKDLDEAPGAMTLKHNQDTEKSNLKAFDLAEDRDHPAVSAITNRILRRHTDLLGKYGPGKVLAAIEDATAGLDELEEIGSSDVSIWVDQIIKGLESGAYDNLKEGPADEPVEPDMDADDKRFDDIDEKIDFAKKIAKHNEKKKETDEKVKQHQKDQKEKPVEEDLDANQKRVGQLGPTEKVGPKGAVGKLVGASESVELGRLKSLSGIK